MSLDHPTIRSAAISAIWSAATAWGFYLMAKTVNHRWHVLRLEQEVAKLQKLLDHERAERRAQRQGRIRAEQELRKHQLMAVTSGAAAVAAAEGTGLVDGAPQPEPVGSSSGGAEGRERAGEDAGPADGLPEAFGSDDMRAAAGPLSGTANGMGGHSASTSNGGSGGAAAAAAAGSRAAGRAQPAGVHGTGLSFPFRPIGTIQSCFSQRNGTPRQPLLVPLARCRLQLVSDVPGDALQGLQQYTHVWVIYIFHENTDLVKIWQGDRSGVKAKIKVPRLNGDKMGVLATRSPHRPVPIGLSVAQVISIQGSCITLGGADIVDGSPVLDLKPYLPFCDSVPGAAAPAWVTAEAEDEPLKVSDVECCEAAAAMVRSCWCGLRGRSLYASGEEFLDLVKQVLSRDIRPVHRRIESPLWADVPAPPPSFYDLAAAHPTAAPTSSDGTLSAAPQLRVGRYHVVLEGLDVSYDVEEGGRIVLRGACPNVVQSQQRGLGLLLKGPDAEAEGR